MANVTREPKGSKPRSAPRSATTPGDGPSRGFSSVKVYEALRKDILELNIQPGTLLDETELAERFGLSRSPVREALVRLSAEGLVKVLRNRSSIVAPFDITTVQHHLTAIDLLYRATARLAALNRTQAQLEALQAMIKRHATGFGSSDGLQLVQNNREFHVAIAEAGGNSIFVTWIATLLDQGQRLMGMYATDVGPERPDALLDDHRAIVAAIAAGDADGAEGAARQDAAVLSSQLKAHMFRQQLAELDVGKR
ncbi:GntR family transcriptional regulator [Novosphingobium sp.]|uniref:GntR family transcriptional regulator n=1 Tax=Novosphingobium sp. TaxID=1874826 RepID=UPI0026158C95|nr:GntR family transcriptional regulator [Novosphingobium sp.]